MKPEPSPNETRNDFMARCIPLLVEEGKAQTQAVAICGSMYDDAKMDYEIDWLKLINNVE